MVKIKVDMENREKLRRLHTATHIVNFCAREVLGHHVWQNGSNLKPEFGTLDITHFDKPTLEEIFEIERLANKIVFDNQEVKIDVMSRDKAEAEYGFTLYQGGAIPMRDLRVISVGDFDTEACGGIHMEKTAGIGLIRLVECSKIQDGVVRLKFVVNEFALEFDNSNRGVLAEVCDVFSVDKSAVVRTSEKFFNEWKKQNKEIESLKKEVSGMRVERILGSSEAVFDFGDLDMGALMEIYTKVMGKKEGVVLKADKFEVGPIDYFPESFKKEINKGKFKVFVK